MNILMDSLAEEDNEDENENEKENEKADLEDSLLIDDLNAEDQGAIK